MELEKTLNSQSNPKKENQSGRHHNPGLYPLLQSYHHQDSMVLAQKQTYRLMEQNREPINELINIWPTNTWQQERISNGIKGVSSANGLGKLDSDMQKNEPGPVSYTIQKNKLKMDERTKCEAKKTQQNPRGENKQ